MAEKEIQTRIRKSRNMKWDKENMCSFSCRVRSYEALIFKEYCAANNTTPYKVLKNHIMQCIEEYNIKSKKIRKDD